MPRLPDEAGTPLQERLAGKALLLTGASGFVGKAVLAPDPARAARHARSPCCCAATPQQRLRERGADERARSRASTAARVKAISGDLGDDGLDRSPAASTSSSTAPRRVSFEQALDEALELNGKGPARLLRGAARRRQRPVLHPRLAPPTPPASAPASCSSARPAPRRRSRWLDLDAELDAARAWRRDIEAESRLPVHQHRFVKEAERAVGPAGGPATGARAEQLPLRRGSATSSSSAAASARARSAGRTPTRSRKAIGERALIAADPRQLTIVRPAIVESALHTPYPGWMESLKVADPILLGYGAGHHPRPLRRQPRRSGST